jgi:cytochrome oxidase assembly protein ShyY1
VPVVRGTVVEPSAAPAVPTGEVTVVGRVEPYEGDPGVQPGDSALPAGQLPRLTAAALLDETGAPAAAGWLALVDQTPTSTLPVVLAPNSPDRDSGLQWQNATYAVQWVLFAAFVVFLWQRWFRDELRERTADDSAPLPVS